MKKTLVALAVAGAFVGAAQAQSSVTLYGIVDANLQYNKNKANNSRSVVGVNSGHQSGSRFGLRGSEDLGGGLRGVFVLEQGFNIDNGAQATAGLQFNRQAYAGLSGGFGDVVLGRFATFSSGTGTFDMWGRVDPFATGFGLSSLTSTFNPTLRVDNTLLYRTPNWGGFQGGLSYSFNRAATEGAIGTNTRQLTAAGSLGIGPVYAVVTYDRILPTDAVENAAGYAGDQSGLQLGAVVDLKVVRIHAAYGIFKNENTGNGGYSVVNSANGADGDAAMLGVTVPIAGGAGGTVLASYQLRDNKLTGGEERDRSVWALGYTYPFSRRTNLYVNYADSDGKKTLNNVATFDSRQATLGLRHTF